MNSFRFLAQGVEAEIARQIAVLEAGDTIEQETLHFDPVSGRLSSLRSKEEAHDYRYFPEPDLVPLVPTEAMMGRARDALPELPADRAARYEGDWSLPVDTARLFAFEPAWGDYFEAAATAAAGRPDPGETAASAEPRAVANWVTELRTRLGAGQDPLSSSVDPAMLAKLAELVAARTVTAGNGRVVLDRMVADGGDPAAIIDAEGLGAMGDSDELAGIVARVIADNPDVAERIRGGNAKAMGALIGPVMRETKGRADGGEVNRLIREQLGV
jgi:aspartyl-tRNA(Asn)/glutamyl-tRNA(Gln) amidotransferase subunit B